MAKQDIKFILDPGSKSVENPGKKVNPLKPHKH
jgi:hypothetical protein